jgi:glycosyltransferase involved in cell wall biosynthesis
VGAFSQRKNFDRVLAAAIRLAREDGVRFRFVGSIGSILSPSAIEVPEDIRDRVTFSGHIEDPAQLAETYCGARCLVFPSLYEASPLPPVEAMHFGCPVVGSDIASMRERCGAAAEYCDPFDTGSIVAAVRRVIADPARADQLRRLGAERAAALSWAAQARIVLAAIRDAYCRRSRDNGSVAG